MSGSRLRKYGYVIDILSSDTKITNGEMGRKGTRANKKPPSYLWLDQ